MEASLSFGGWLRERRKELDLTQFDLAERVGCSEDTVQKIERGERRPSKQIAQRLAECLGIPPGEREAFVVAARDGDLQKTSSTAAWPGNSRQVPSPSLRPSPAGPTNLPTPLTPLVGREVAVAEARGFLSNGVRLLTLTGAPGIGKTRLSLHVASDLLADFEDGVFLVELAPISNPDLVAPTIAGALGLSALDSQPIPDALKQFLGGRSSRVEGAGKRMLLLLDNFEQVLDAAPLVVDLLTSCPQLKVLVTSREALHVAGEQQLPVLPLPTPDPSQLLDWRTLPEYPAVDLFIQRASATDPGFRLSEENSRSVAVICSRLEGLPFAIELAAARIKVFSPQVLLSRLESRLRTLTGGPRGVPQRQQTLRGAIEWSYDLLTEEEKKLFLRLAVFVGGRSIEAAEAVCNPDGDLGIDVVEGLISLVDKSLLRQEEGAGGASRFVMLETIHEYAREKLWESGEGDAQLREHALYFMRLAEEAEPYLSGERQQEWLMRLDEEHDNIRAALRWARERGANGNAEALEIGLRTGAALWRFALARGYISEVREELERLLDLQEIAAQASEKEAYGSERALGSTRGSAMTVQAKRSRANALNQMGALAGYQGDNSLAIPILENSLALFRELGDKAGIASAVGNLGGTHRCHGDYTTARALLEESLDLHRELGDKVGMSFCLLNLGNVFTSQGEYAAARSLYEECLALRRQLGNKRGMASCLNNLGNVAQYCEEYSTARAIYEESLALAREFGDKYSMSYALGNLGNVTYRQGDYAAALTMHKEALSLGWEVGDKSNSTFTLAGVGAATVSVGQTKRGVRLLGAVEALLEETGRIIDQEDRIPYDHAVVAAREQMSGEDLERAWQEGRTMSMEQAVDYALQEDAPEVDLEPDIDHEQVAGRR